MTKDRSGIKSILSIHTPRREVVVKKPRPTVQEMLDHEDLKNTYDPYWWISDTPEVTLKPQEPPKDKYGNTPAQKEKMINDWLTRPADKYKYEPWANKKVERLEKPKPKKMPVLTYIDKMNVAYGNQEKRKYDDQGYPLEANEQQMEGLKKRLDNARQMTGHKYPVTPERKQKVRVNNTTREKPDGQV